MKRGEAPTTGFLHPGAMGVTVAAACTGFRCWVSEFRSDETRTRAATAGLTDVGSLDELVSRCDTIVSVCPPDQALTVAGSVADAGFDGVYVDANAISPMTAATIGERFDRFVDGGIIGPPATEPGTTRLYLSGDEAATVAERWAGSVLDVRPIAGGVGAASALKMLFAGWTKGTTALLLAINGAAEHHGVAEALHDEWKISLPDLPGRSAGSAGRTALKAWRFDGEMREIAATLAAAGLPAEFHEAAADVYARLAGFKGADPAPDLDDVIARLLDR